ncbi:MAG TPA: c-type cytochrome [Actinomycetota bacterium]|nr:c-type cytochrome [Actinomycetota bacterium]
MSRLGRGTLTILTVVGLAAVSAACGPGTSNRLPPPQVPGGQPNRGVTLIEHYGCGACHTIPGIRGADANVGPPLVGIGDRRYIAGVLVNNADNMVRWLMDPPAIVSGVDMPNMGISREDAEDIAAYLYTLRGGG